MTKKTILGISAALVLAACGQNATAPQSPQGSVSAQGKATTTTLTPCQALYAARPTTVQVQSNMRYGSVGTLILSFVDETTKGQAIDWMDSEFDVDLGDGLGAFDVLPIVAIKTLVTPEVVAKLQQKLEPLGLVSIYQDEPLQYFLGESTKFIGSTQARQTFGLSGKGVGVAVIDSGIDGTHPDLQLGQNIGRNVKIVGSILDTPLGGYMYADLPNTDTTSGHGTHVAGTIAGTGAASKGKYVGVAPGTTLLGIGAGDGISILYALQGFDFALKQENREKYNIRIISNSWGTSGSRFAPYNPISIASKQAYDLGIIVNFAAGNEGPGQDTLNPYSASPCVMSVAAGDKKGYLADFSSRGVPGDPYHHPDITAPGVKIVAARDATGAVTPPYTADPENALYYSSLSGTSMATPHISGVQALMLEANPKLKLDDILAIFQKTARPVYHTTGTVTSKREAWEVGYGYVDAYAAIKRSVELNPTRYTLTTTKLPAWTGTVNTAVCAPLVDCAVNAEHTHTLTVPSGQTALRINTDWGNPAYDLDLYVYDPSGNLAGSSAQAASTGEAVSIPYPAAGTWKVVLKGYLNAATSYNGTAEVDKLTQVK